MELLERDTAVEALEGALAQARAGAGRIVLVAGEAGVGKTALTDRVARAAREPVPRQPEHRAALDPAMSERTSLYDRGRPAPIAQMDRATPS